MKNIYNFSLILIVLTIQNVIAEITVDDICAGIKMRQSMLKSVKCDFNYVFSRPNTALVGDTSDNYIETTPFVDYDFNTIRLGQKIKVEQREKDLTTGKCKGLEIVAWDGQIRTGYHADLQNPNAKYRGSVEPEKGGFFMGYWPTALEAEVFDIKKPLAKVLDMCPWQLEEIIDMKNYTVAKIKSKNLWNGKVTLEVWVAIDKDFAPVKLQRTIQKTENTKTIIQTMDNVELVKSGNVWVIEKARIKLFNPNLLMASKGGYCFFKANNYEIGMPVDEKTFKVKFPRGTWVYDSILKQGYAVGEGIWVGDPNSGVEYIPFKYPPELSTTSMVGKKVSPSPNANVMQSCPNHITPKKGIVLPYKTVSRNNTLLVFLFLALSVGIIVIFFTSKFFRKHR